MNTEIKILLISFFDYMVSKRRNLKCNWVKNQINLTNLFKLRTFIIPTTDLIVASKHVHGHHADGQRHCPHYDFPGMGGHKEAVHSEKSWQHCSYRVLGSWKEHQGWTLNIQLTVENVLNPALKTLLLYAVSCTLRIILFGSVPCNSGK